MNSLVIDIRAKLVALGVGTLTADADWAVHAGAYPDRPARVISIFQTSIQYQGVMGTKRTMETSRFQIRVRGLNPVEVDVKMEEIRLALHRVGRFVVAPVSPATCPVLYLDIIASGGSIPLGRDAKDLSSVVLNMVTFREDVVTPAP